MHAPSASRWQIWLLILSVVVATAACGLSWQLSWISKRREFLKIQGVHDLSESYGRKAADRPRAPCLLWLLGEKGLDWLAVMESSSANFSQAKSLFPEAQCDRPAFISGAIHYR